MEKIDKKILIALGAGLGAAVIATLIFIMIDASGKPAEISQKVVEVRVLKAAQDIPEGMAVTPEMVTYTTVPAMKMTDDMVVDQVQIANVKTARAITAESLLRKGDFQLVTVTSIPEGHVAMSLKVDTVSGVTWMVKEGDLIDVVGVLRPTEPGDRRGNVSTLLLQAIRVLAVESPKPKKDQQVATTEKGSVTLLMKPDEAQKLMLIATAGDYALALRGSGDETQYDITPVSVAEMISRKKPVKAAVAPKRVISQNQLQVVEVK